MAEPSVELDFLAKIGGLDQPPPFVSQLLPPDSPPPALVDRHVGFARGGSAELPADAQKARACRRMLERLWQIKHPVFAQLDEHRVITGLFAPFVGRVVYLERAHDGTFYVGLGTSAIRFVLPPTHRRFSELLKDLKLAKKDRTPRIVSATADRHVIVDVSPDDTLHWFAIRDGGEFIPRPVKGNGAIARASSVSQDHAERLFADLLPESCELPEDEPGCIPFLYPDDGCWARAHAVCELLRKNHSLRAVKVWAHGSLGMRTRLSPECSVGWHFHVAPALKLAGERAHLLVLDHMLFDGPRSRTAWKTALGDRDAHISITEAIIWNQEAEGVFQTEPKGQQAFDLEKYRKALEQRVDCKGPPPYNRCRL